MVHEKLLVDTLALRFRLSWFSAISIKLKQINNKGFFFPEDQAAKIFFFKKHNCMDIYCSICTFNELKIHQCYVNVNFTFLSCLELFKIH